MGSSKCERTKRVSATHSPIIAEPRSYVAIHVINGFAAPRVYRNEAGKGDGVVVEDDRTSGVAVVVVEVEGGKGWRGKGDGDGWCGDRGLAGGDDGDDDDDDDDDDEYVSNGACRASNKACDDSFGTLLPRPILVPVRARTMKRCMSAF